MLNQCAAYLLARNDRHLLELELLCQRLGFGHVEALYSRQGFRPAEHHPPLRFFLMFHHMDGRLVAMVRNVIRSSDDPNIRFAPIILFTEECEYETYLGFVRMGFDDVLTLPDKKEMVVHRLETQINTDHVYFETTTYLGPDRRRMEAADHVDDRRGKGAQSYVRHTIRRTVEAGSRVLASDIIGSPLG